VRLLMVRLLFGFCRLRESDFQRDDSLVLRLMGFRKVLDVSTISPDLRRTEQKEHGRRRTGAGPEMHIFPGGWKLTKEFKQEVASSCGSPVEGGSSTSPGRSQ